MCHGQGIVGVGVKERESEIEMQIQSIGEAEYEIHCDHRFICSSFYHIIIKTVHVLALCYSVTSATSRSSHCVLSRSLLSIISVK